MDEITKSLPLTKTKIVEATDGDDSERRVTFIASSESLDRDDEVVKIGTFFLPTRGGGLIRVSDLPAGGSEDVAVPLIADHDIGHVDKTIGSVRRASFDGTNLIIEAGISSRPYAQDLFTLIKEGHLDNAFSVRCLKCLENTETHEFEAGEIIEISLVTRAANRQAEVLAIKSLNKGEEMDNDTNKEANAEAAQTEAPADTQAGSTETTTSEGAEEQTEAPTEPKSNEEAGEPKETTDKEKSMNDTNHKELAASQVMKAPSQTATSTANVTKSYLSTKEAVLQFAKIAKSCGGDPTLTEETWKEHLVAKGVTISGGGHFLPTEVEQVMFKAWHDAIGALSTFRRTRAKMSRFYAMTVDGDTGRAGGHTPGDDKGDQDVVAIPRITGLRVIFKKLPIDWIDIVNDDSGELYLFRTRELTDRVLGEIVRGAILGDGRTAPAEGQADRRVFVDGLGLYSIAADIKASADTSTTNGQYAATVATQIANVSTDDDYAKIIKTLGRVRVEPGQRRVLVIPDTMLESFLLATNAQGQRLYPVGTDFKELFGVSEIVEFTPEEMAATGFDVIAYRDQAYTLGGIDLVPRNWFDGNKNKDVMMVEIAVQGSLEGYHAAAGYTSATVPAKAASTK